MSDRRHSLQLDRSRIAVAFTALLLVGCDGAKPGQSAQAAPAPGPAPRLGEPAGPSFDCAKAATPLEKEICRDPQAAQADRAVAEAWRAALAATPKEFRPALTQGQRSFLRFADAACRTDDGYAEGCLARVYEERRDVLAGTVKNSFITLVAYDAPQGVPAGDEGEPPLKIVKLRQFARPADAAERRWNAAVAERFERFQYDYRVRGGDWGTHVFSAYPVATSKDFIQTQFEYDDGSRYGSDRPVHWVLSRDRELVASDLFEDAALDALARLAAPRAQVTGGGSTGSADVGPDEVRAALADLDNWSFDQGGLYVRIGEDPPVVIWAEVPWAEVKPLLRKDAAFDPTKLKSAL